MSECDRAKAALVEDWKRMAIWFDGGPELLSHEQMHRHHKTEPYIGCCFCRDQFVPRAELERLEAVAHEALVRLGNNPDAVTDALGIVRDGGLPGEAFSALDAWGSLSSVLSPEAT